VAVHARSRRVVFVIDGDDEVRVTHETILRGEGYEILGAPDSAAALVLLREQRPDLLLLSTGVGTFGVIQLLRVLRADESMRNVKVVVYGGREENVRESARKAEAHGYLELPISPQRLVREVVVLIGRA
jgi:CheY-like chemotaxis protein